MYSWTVLALFVFIYFCSASDDLLDEYVRHVQESSKYTTQSKKEHRITRSKRSTQNEDTSRFIQKWDQEIRLKRALSPQIPSRTIQKAFGNRMMLKKLLQTTKTEKKINRISKRTKRENQFFLGENTMDLMKYKDNINNKKNPEHDTTKSSKVFRDRYFNSKLNLPSKDKVIFLDESKIKTEEMTDNFDTKNVSPSIFLDNEHKSEQIKNLAFKEIKPNISINKKRFKNPFRYKRHVTSRSAHAKGFLQFDQDGIPEKRESRRIPMQWTHEQMLDDDGDIILKWQPRHQEIAFRLEAKTRGYVAIGFSPSGGMKNADIVIGWMDDVTGLAYLLDCHASEDEPNGQPIRDDVENYTLMRGFHNDTHTILEFRRALDTCDPEDFVLGTDTVRVIWALHDSDPPAHGSLQYHESRRGEQSVYLLGPPTVSYPENTRNWDVTLKNFVMPDTTDTYYWCKIFKAPTLQSKHHIVGYEPILGPRHKAHLHHMLVRECQMNGINAAIIAEWERSTNMEGATCYGHDMPRLWEACSTPLLAWAVGSKGEILPQHIGIPIAESTPRYYMLEVHFDNPGLKRAKDTSGIRIRYTHQLRKHDAGILSAGVALTSLHVIPPKQPEYRSAGYCSTDCTKSLFPKDGINVVSVLLHSHLAGKKMNLRHLRGGRELSPIVQDNQYDFNYQQTRMLSQEVTILPGDALITECTYSTKKRPKPTIGGYSTSNEMCLAFVLHYPKSELSACYSMPPVQYFFDTFGVKEFYNKNMSQLNTMFLDSNSDSSRLPQQSPSFPTFPPGAEDSAEANLKVEQAIREARDYTIEGEENTYGGPLDQLVIKEPQEFRNKTFMSHLNEIPWQEDLLTKRIEESFYSGQHLTFCRKRDDTLSIPEKIEMFPNFTKYVDGRSKVQCSYRLQHSTPSKNNRVISSRILVLLTVLVIFK